MATSSWQQKRPERDEVGLARSSDTLPSREERGAGALLRQAREEMGWSIQQVGQTLKIRPEYLDAFERNSLEGLPGPAYAMGFLKTYADFLNLDTGEIVRRFKAEKSSLGHRPELTFPVPLTDRGLPGGGLFLTALILIALGYGTWYYMSSGRHSTPPAVEPVPSQLLNPPPTNPINPQTIVNASPPQPGAAVNSNSPEVGSRAASTETPPVTTQTVIAPQIAASAPPTPAKQEAAAPMPPATPDSVSAKPAENNAPTDANASGPHNYGQQNAGHIVLRANASSWVQVKENGSPIFTRVLKAGDTYNVPDRPGMVLRTGNAGGIEIVTDGKTMPPLGAQGQVKGNVQLDSAKLASQPTR